jgi:hypothetical protein
MYKLAKLCAALTPGHCKTSDTRHFVNRAQSFRENVSAVTTCCDCLNADFS